MKKIFFLPLASFIVAACSEPTASTATSDLTPSYAKPVPPPPSLNVTGDLVYDVYVFDGDAGIASAGLRSNWGTDLPSGFAGASDASTVAASNGTTNRFLGRFENVATQALLVLPDGGSEWKITFDLYTIGSWDGKGKQAQSGTFQANAFVIGYRCSGAGAGIPIFTTTFSNQLTVQQDFPNSFGLGGFKAASGSLETDALGFRDDPSSNTPPFRSFGDVTYRLTYSGVNACASDAITGDAITFVFSTAAPPQQGVYDESWGLDNVTILADN